MIPILNVFYWQQKEKLFVGRLAYRERKIYFEYDKAFLASGIELSPYKLPLKAGLHSCEDRVFEGLYGVFADSLPDGWGKLLLDRHLMSQGRDFVTITPLDRLSHVGNFGIGALCYEPVAEEMQLSSEPLVLDDLAYSSRQILQGTSQEMLETLLAIGGSSAGARPKVMIQLNDALHIVHGAQKLQEGYAHYIVKFPSSSDAPESGKLEYIYASMARDAHIWIPQTLLLHTQKSSYFAIKRFDRRGDERVHTHSVAGMVHTDFRLPSLDYDDLLGLTLHLTQDVQEQARMFRLAVFNLLAHNRDDHAKNFSFLLDTEGWKLACAYDLTFSHGPGGEHSTTYLGEGKSPTSRHLLALATKHKIKNAQSIIDEVADVINAFPHYAKKVELSGAMTREMTSVLRQMHTQCMSTTNAI